MGKRTVSNGIPNVLVFVNALTFAYVMTTWIAPKVFVNVQVCVCDAGLHPQVCICDDYLDCTQSVCQVCICDDYLDCNQSDDKQEN